MNNISYLYSPDGSTDPTNDAMIPHVQWRRSQVKNGGGVNIEKIEGVGSGEGLCLPFPFGGLGACPQKKKL